MRLTLRTLLAYVDEQLSKEDAEEIRGKIEKSDFARRLQRRINMLSSRRNVPAPQVHIRGVGEANSVAEYIDGSMASEKVADFEKACLESDIHLSEVTACHTILTKLGEPEQVTPELRRRIYMLDKFPVDGTVSDSDSNANIELHSAIAERFVDSGEEKIVLGKDVFELSAPSDFRGREYEESPSDDVSGIARQSQPATTVRYRVLPILGAVASALVLTFLILLATLDRGGNELADSGPREVLSDGSPDTRETIPEKMEAGETTDAGSDTAPENPMAVFSADTTPVPDLKIPSDDSTTNEPAIDAPKTDDAAPDSASVNETPIAPETPAMTETPAFAPAAPEKINKLDFFRVIPDRGGLEVAKVSSASQLLVRADAAKDNWQIVADNSTIRENQHLMVFPFFRPAIAFTKIKLTACDGGIFQVLPVSERSVSGVSIQQGRYLLSNSGGTLVEFAVIAGDIAGIVTLQQEDSVMAIDVRRSLPPGIDPKSMRASARARTEVELTCVAGRCMWESDGDARQIDQRLALTVVSGDSRAMPELQATESLAAWMIGETTGEIDQDDAQLLYQSLAPNADISRSLLNAMETEPIRENVRAMQLAMLCQLQLGDASQIAALLDNSAPAFVRAWLWRSVIGASRVHLSRDTGAAAKFEERLLATDPDGGKFFRMLYGFDNDQLAGGSDATLVAALESERLAIRVLAHQTLQEITGESLLFRPESDLRTRVRHVESWKKAMEAEKIRR